jgi:hypothetical protein
MRILKKNLIKDKSSKINMPVYNKFLIDISMEVNRGITKGNNKKGFMSEERIIRIKVLRN